jgi:hypothetical protein
VFACQVDHGFEPQSGQFKDYKTGICCFSAKHAALRRKSKNGLARNQDIVSNREEIEVCYFTLHAIIRKSKQMPHFSPFRK